MENKNNSENEMFLMSKYKYINKIAKSVAQVATANINTNVGNNIPNGSENIDSKLSKEEEKAKKKAEAELAAKLKEEKKKKMAEMCKPGTKNENKTKFVEKEKYVDDTPVGEKKGKKKFFIFFYKFNKKFFIYNKNSNVKIIRKNILFFRSRFKIILM